VSEQVNRRCPPWNTILQLSTRVSVGEAASNSPSLEQWMLVPSCKYIKNTVNKWTPEHFQCLK